MNTKWLTLTFLFGIFGLSMSESLAQAHLATAKSVQVYAHRGGRAFSPENTLPAYESSLKIGTDWLDMDIVMTRDGEILVAHDLILNPNLVQDQSGQFLAPSLDFILKEPAQAQAEYIQKYLIKKLTLSELKAFTVGHLNRNSSYAKYFPEQVSIDGVTMPTLREVIQKMNRATDARIGFQIEMKTDPLHPEWGADPEVFAEALYKILTEEGILDRAEIQAFDFRCLVALKKLDPKVKTAFLTSRENEPNGNDDFFNNDPKLAGRWTGGPLVKDYGNSIPKMVKALGGYAWEPEDAELTEESLLEAKSLGLKVVTWTYTEKLKTAFDPELVAKMIQWGVDGIITDDPGRLISMLAARGLGVPRRY